MIADAYRIMAEAIEEHVTKPGKRLAGEVVLYSGGNDSTVLAHLFRHDVDWAAHINTGIGIEETRQFVRDTCKTWGLPLIEEHAVTDLCDRCARAAHCEWVAGRGLLCAVCAAPDHVSAVAAAPSPRSAVAGPEGATGAAGASRAAPAAPN